MKKSQQTIYTQTTRLFRVQTEQRQTQNNISRDEVKGATSFTLFKNKKGLTQVQEENKKNNK